MPEIHRRKLGEFDLISLSDGFFRLDGGAMFGIVPKTLWEKRIPADGRNRIRLGLRPLLIRTPEGSALVDTGIGEKYDAKELDIYAIEHPPTLEGALREAGVSPDEIRFVINTHLHFDHAGGNTERRGEDVLPAFPGATTIVQEKEWLAAVHPGERSRGSYKEENVLPLEAAGIVDRVDGEFEPLPGVRLVPTPGHTGGHQSVRITSGGETAFYPGDLVPTASHVDPPWVMGYDLYPEETVAHKRELLARACDENWLLCFEHDPSLSWGRVARDGSRFRICQG
ncbi:MAG: MBL fold metallo-hydrolase [Planctomycetota bacterium]|jgi:glyoxylase-like metal-dependent hydrolase (beta-lactamase superfamily II)